MIGFAMTGSFCTHKKALSVLEMLVEQGEDVLPIVSEAVARTDTRFGKAQDLLERLKRVCGRDIISDIPSAEPLGSKIALSALIICPCTGNTAAKIACGITDTTVTMAAKAHLRCDRPLILALASNDALSGNFRTIASLMEKKNVYFVPMAQDDPTNKPHSLTARLHMTAETLSLARQGKQHQPVFLCPDG